MWLFDSKVSAEYSTCPSGIVSLLMLTITYIQALHVHTQGRFNNHTAHCLYRIMVTVTSVMGVMKIRNTVPRAGLEPTYLAFRPVCCQIMVVYGGGVWWCMVKVYGDGVRVVVYGGDI